MSEEIFPWLKPVAERLPTTLPSAVLIVGQKGLGKERLALHLAQARLCEDAASDARPCGVCVACHLFDIGHHPDFRLLQPGNEQISDPPRDSETEEKTKGKSAGTQILVAAVRDLTGLVTETAHRGRAKVVLISPAEAMHPSAANALLKMLEEPPTNTHFLLVSHEPHRVLRTVASRCFRLPVTAPAGAIALQWLADRIAGNHQLTLSMSGYAPAAAAELAQNDEFWSARKSLLDRFVATETPDPLAMAAEAAEMEPALVAELLSMWCYDILAIDAGIPPRYHVDIEERLRGQARDIDTASVATWQSKVTEFARAAYHPLNRRLALEALFLSLALRAPD